MQRKAWLYTWSILTLGAAFSLLSCFALGSAAPPFELFLVLLIGTTFLRLFVVAGPRHITFEGSTLALFASALILPFWQFVLLVLLSHTVEWAKERLKKSDWLKAWYLQPFNISKVIIAGACTRSLMQLLQIDPTGPVSFITVLGIMLLVLVYGLVNQFILGGALFLARGVTFRESGVLRDAFMIEAPLACIGYIAIELLQRSPLMFIFVLGPILLVHQAFRLPGVEYEAMQSLKRMNQELTEANQAIRQLNDELFQTVAKIFDTRDPYVGGHAAQVATYAAAIATELGMSPERISIIRQCGYLHDIGKIAIPEVILHKPGPLTAQEFELLKRHPDIGADLISTSKGLRHLAPFVRHHHERWDGLGYPDRLAGEAIPLEARILSVCDSVEAMASDRPYRPALTMPEITREIEKCAGKQFDPKVVEVFIRLAEQEGSRFIVNSARTVAAQHSQNDKTLEGLPASFYQALIIPND